MAEDSANSSTIKKLTVWEKSMAVLSGTKTTPLLVPYEELPESEKEYDRNTAFETLKLIIKMGYQIKRP